MIVRKHDNRTAFAAFKELFANLWRYYQPGKKKLRAAI